MMKMKSTIIPENILIDTEMQQQLLVLFKENGADTSIGFDEYVEQDTYVKP